MNDGITYRELEILADLRVEGYDVNILDGHVLARFVMEAYGLGPTSVQSVSSLQGTLLALIIITIVTPQWVSDLKSSA